jgi:hypothetical protein
VNFNSFVLWCTTHASASLKPDERFGFDLQRQLHPRAGPRCNSRRGRLPGSGQTYSRRHRGFEFQVAKQCLAHTVGNGVTRAHLRTTMLERRRKVMASWAAFPGWREQRGGRAVSMRGAPSVTPMARLLVKSTAVAPIAAQA